MTIKTLVTLLILAGTLQFAPLAFAQSPAGPGQNAKQLQDARFANLTPEERTKLQNAHQKAMQDPAVQAARDKMQQATKDFHDKMHAALLKADPSIQPILDKVPMGPMGEHHGN
jgi:hypothetical protein